MSERIFELSNGDKVVIKPLTMKQARACKLSKIVTKLMANTDEKGNIKPTMIDEDDMLNVISQVYSKANSLPYFEAVELFSAIIEETMGKK